MTILEATQPRRGAHRMTTATATIIEAEDGDWSERDNFGTEAAAREYAAFLSGKFPLTPYRIVRRADVIVGTYGPATTANTNEKHRDRFVVEFIHV